MPQLGLRMDERDATICQLLRQSGSSYHRNRREYVGLKINQSNRLKHLEKEGERFKKAVSSLTIDTLIVKEVVARKYLVPRGDRLPFAAT